MKLLVAEDDPGFRLFLQTALGQRGHDVLVTGNGREACRLLLETPVRLAILDWMMPEMTGPEICQAVRAQVADRPTYLILVTSKSGTTNVVTGLDSGADDYLSKPFDPEELYARVGVGLRILGMQDQLIAAREELRRQATHDPLTGHWNRGAILEILERELSRARRMNTHLGVILADLDHFKQVNDCHGHLAGDAVLREVTRRMGSVLRNYDAIGRYGGEEFLIILPSCDATALAGLAERIRNAVACDLMAIDGRQVPATVSLGAISVPPDSTSDQRVLLDRADKALYQAKHRGRNRVTMSAS